MKKKAIKTRSKKIIVPPQVQNELETVKNNINNNFQFGLNEFNPQSIGTQLNQVNTLFINNRWYLVSNMRQLLSETYVEHGLIQTICDVPVDDGFRGGIDIISKQLDPAQIEEVKAQMEEHDDLGKLAQTAKWNRLFGGAGLLTLTDQDPSEPFREIKKGESLEFRDCDMWELFWSHQNTSDYSAAIDTTEMYDVEYFDYYGEYIHKSRVSKMTGIRAPSFIRPRLRGWGLSVVEIMIDSINQFLKSNNLTFQVLDEFKIDYYKLKGFASTLISSNGAAKVQNRVQQVNAWKNFQNAVIMDAEDDFTQKQLSFTGIAEVMAGIRMQIASALRMPMTKIFGISAAGFSSGEDDIENYNAMVERQVREKTKFITLRVVKLRCQQLFGFTPDDLQIQFRPLRILSAEQEENVKTQKFTRILQAKQLGEIDTKEFRDACNKDNLLGIQLDVSIGDLEANEPEEQNEASQVEGPKPRQMLMAPKSQLEAKEAKQ